jgi:hypothetical protein
MRKRFLYLICYFRTSFTNLILRSAEPAYWRTVQIFLPPSQSVSPQLRPLATALSVHRSSKLSDSFKFYHRRCHFLSGMPNCVPIAGGQVKDNPERRHSPSLEHNSRAEQLKTFPQKRSIGMRTNERSQIWTSLGMAIKICKPR